jgi:hypothetical protein
MIYDIHSDIYVAFLSRWQHYEAKWNRKYGDPDNPTKLTMAKEQNFG